jgi:flavin-dependent dehydrogenase
MHICVIGDGVAGLMAANLFASRDYVTKVTNIGSSKIPTIGVGESTTLNFESLHREFDSNFDSFICESNACIKLGVLYSGWSENEFLHYFKHKFLFDRNQITPIEYYNSLANKNKEIYIHDLMGGKLIKDAKKNLIPAENSDQFYGKSWHFDAGKYILYLKKILKDKKVDQIDDVVIDCKFKSKGDIEFIILESKRQVIADYYIVCTGKHTNSSKIFQIEYQDLSNILLTDKALFFPKKYQNKEKELHPYTIAKTMKYGWRWITPTWERVGTGYVFSSRYIGVEQAIEEFQQDIGDMTIIPNVVDFYPKYSSKTFNKNYMTLGMCNGFLEPLDAPGLAISCALTMIIDNIFRSNRLNENYQKRLNEFVNEMYLGWAAFILSQYKTCNRSDTEFWVDHKNVKFDYLENLMNNLHNDYVRPEFSDIEDPNTIIDAVRSDLKSMVQNTVSSRNINWTTKCDTIPFKLDDSDYESQSHYSFLIKKHSGPLS